MLALALVALALAGTALADEPANEPAQTRGVLGTWEGTIGPDTLDLGIRVTFSGTPGSLEGTIDIAAQGLIGSALSDVSLQGDAVHFVMDGVPGTPTFDGMLAGDSIDGTFTQGGQSLPFELTRSQGEAAALRPQEPKPPFPYESIEVSYPSADVTIAGTLTVPQGSGPFPAALLITGSGPQDRDEDLLGHKPFLLIADTLTRAGVAVLRVDDRGVGGSTGSDADADYEDLVGDALAGVAFLADRPEVDPARIGVIGHSQGGYLAPVVADESDAEHPVAFVVMIAGPAVDGEAVLLLQNERIFELSAEAQDPPLSQAETKERVDEQVGYVKDLVKLLEDGNYDAAAELVRTRVKEQIAALPAEDRPDADAVESFVDAQVQAAVSPSMASFVSFDPQPFLRELRVPVLAIYGSLDVQVPASQSVGPLREALTAAGNHDFSIVTFQGLNHLMQPAITGSPSEYGTIATTMDPIVLQTIRDWIVGRFGKL